MTDIIDDDTVYFIERQANGTFRLDATATLEELGGNVPNSGDRYTVVIHEAGTAISEVVGRYYVRHIVEKTQAEWRAWFVVVRPTDLEESDALDAIITQTFKEQVEDRPPVVVEPNKSPFRAWKRKQRERDKYRPHLNLDAREERILRFMIAHPDYRTVDLIPQAGEKTMEALLKVGVVRSIGRDARGAREWLVTEEGRAEVDSIDTYRSWKF